VSDQGDPETQLRKKGIGTGGKFASEGNRKDIYHEILYIKENR
jgi:hypothetical protein